MDSGVLASVWISLQRESSPKSYHRLFGIPPKQGSSAGCLPVGARAGPFSRRAVFRAPFSLLRARRIRSGGALPGAGVEGSAEKWVGRNEYPFFTLQGCERLCVDAHLPLNRVTLCSSRRRETLRRLLCVLFFLDVYHRTKVEFRSCIKCPAFAALAFSQWMPLPLHSILICTGGLLLTAMTALCSVFPLPSLLSRPWPPVIILSSLRAGQPSRIAPVSLDGVCRS